MYNSNKSDILTHSFMAQTARSHPIFCIYYKKLYPITPHNHFLNLTWHNYNLLSKSVNTFLMFTRSFMIGATDLLLIFGDFCWMQNEHSWIQQSKWVMTLSLAATQAKLIHRWCRCVCVTPCLCVLPRVCVWAPAHPRKWAQVYVCVCAHMPVFMHACVLVCVSWLESRASLRWAAADILVCFNPLANKTAGNHQKNTSSWTGRRAWGGRGEERKREKRKCVL